MIPRKREDGRVAKVAVGANIDRPFVSVAARSGLQDIAINAVSWIGIARSDFTGKVGVRSVERRGIGGGCAQ